jgi:predicted  nucleic acid-binding Zn-ribbon protein
MACHVRLRPQLVCEAKLYTEVMHCDNCKRILLWSGDGSAVPATPPAEASN